MRFLTTSALGLAVLAAVAAARRPRPKRADTAPETPAARVDPGALVTWLVRVPDNTPPGDPVQICGDLPELGGWSAAGVPLRQVEPRLYRADVYVPRGVEAQYKVTRGNWSCVEKHRNGAERANRHLVVTDDHEVMLDVECWSDLP